jgi:UDP-N-acetylmuramoyl-L-alanyl-D-glutamate--2,6-diaminopimelate ligase
LNIDGHDVYARLIGEFNASNLLAVYTVATLLGEAPLNVLTALSDLEPPRGRFQLVRSTSGIIGIVDYAHTPDALKNVLSTINDVCGDNEQVITVVGCGGDRDRTKRPSWRGSQRNSAAMWCSPATIRGARNQWRSSRRCAPSGGQ